MATERAQTRGEEIANSASHALACLAAITAIPFLLTPNRWPSPSQQAGIAVFVSTMVFAYLASALYHALPPGRAKHLAMRVDHCAIFLFIAGTYTPLSMKMVHAPWGWSLLTGIWMLSLVGLVAKACGRLEHPIVSILFYVFLGWMAVLVAGPVLSHMPTQGMGWLFGGGAAYTIGAAFYAFDRHIKFGHLVWHLFAIGGTTCHYLAVCRYL